MPKGPVTCIKTSYKVQRIYIYAQCACDGHLYVVPYVTFNIYALTQILQ